MNTHTIHPDLLSHRVHVTLVGCGGNGSQMLTGLARLHLAMLALGHPYGLHVTAYDPDRVSTANVGRQLFYPGDVGQYKACILVHRLNLAFGLEWDARPLSYDGADLRLPPDPLDLLITCVDTARARRQIYHSLSQLIPRQPRYWLDLGNELDFGHAILGEFDRPKPISAIGTTDDLQRHMNNWHNAHAAALKRATQPRLPLVVDVYPELLDPDVPETDTPSCSLAEALQRQSLFVNDHVTRWGLQLLSDLFRHGRLKHHGYLVNLVAGKVNPLPVPAPEPEPETAKTTKRARTRQKRVRVQA